MNARPVPALPPALNRALERVIGCLPTVSDREEPLESDMKQVRSLEAAIVTALEAAEARERERAWKLLEAARQHLTKHGIHGDNEPLFRAVSAFEAAP